MFRGEIESNDDINLSDEKINGISFPDFIESDKKRSFDWQKMT